MQISGKNVIVVGLGKSGIAATHLCARLGAKVVATDSAPAEKLAPEVPSLPAEVVVGGHQGVAFGSADLIVISPGVPSFPELAEAEGRGVPVVGELSLASSQLAVPLLLVGGTNGKSTTTSLLGEILKTAGVRTFVGGNLGTPASEAVGLNLDVAVLEVSSFQLERAPGIKPKVSILLNITEDHLDRYATFQDYADAKGNAFASQAAGAGGRLRVPPPGQPRRRTSARNWRRGRRLRGRFRHGDRASQRATLRARAHQAARPSQPHQRRLRDRGGARHRRAGAGHPTSLARFPAAGAPHGAGHRAARRALLRRLEGHQRRRGGHGAARLERSARRADRRRSRQARLLRAAGRRAAQEGTRGGVDR